MHQQGLIVTMISDAVNDAAALKQADNGVAMAAAARSPSTRPHDPHRRQRRHLVGAVEIGRRAYEKVVAYVCYQMTQVALCCCRCAATATATRSTTTKGWRTGSNPCGQDAGGSSIGGTA